mmetsp:Transcript_41364/g.86782  ORF Transcript_41364/g.86782 Transcript_41364/m.86782 type:complete len:218 (-) Transcript_41364:2531-3184(-)
MAHGWSTVCTIPWDVSFVELCQNVHLFLVRKGGSNHDASSTCPTGKHGNSFGKSYNGWTNNAIRLGPTLRKSSISTHGIHAGDSPSLRQSSPETSGVTLRAGRTIGTQHCTQRTHVIPPELNRLLAIAARSTVGERRQRQTMTRFLLRFVRKSEPIAFEHVHVFQYAVFFRWREFDRERCNQLLLVNYRFFAQTFEVVFFIAGMLIENPQVVITTAR